MDGWMDGWMVMVIHGGSGWMVVVINGDGGTFKGGGR